MPAATPVTTNFSTSQKLLERARRSLAGGVSSPFRAKAPVPLYFRGGEGARLEDVDGNRYIDYALAWGPAILGYRHPKMVEAMAQAAVRPHVYGAQHELEIAVAERLCSLIPAAGLVSFTSSGSEALQIVLRIARAATGRNLVLKFEGHYHGWIDSTLVSYKPPAGCVGPHLESAGQVANALDNLLIGPWNDAAWLEQAIAARGGEIAAIVMEPVLCNSGCLMPQPGYLELARKLATRCGAVLIFDEVITGFRIGIHSAQGHFGVTPDLATFGKAIGGGLPLSAFAGRADLMETMYAGNVRYGGTFNGNPVSLAAADAALEVLSANEGEALKRANALGERLMDGIAGAAARHGIPLTVTGFGTAFTLHFSTHTGWRNYRDTLHDDAAQLRRFLIAALERGLHLLPDGRWYTSAAHTEADIEETLAIVESSFQVIA
jgi:glutamate-1-semialdehyde 2,1-aminomutase